jgi:hypothetical protein
LGSGFQDEFTPDSWKFQPGFLENLGILQKLLEMCNPYLKVKVYEGEETQQHANYVL